MKIKAVVLVLAFALTGCGGGSSAVSTAASPESTAATAVAGATETTGPVATTEQYASIIARNRDLRELVKDMQDCDWLGSGSLDYEPGSLVCSINLITLGISPLILTDQLRYAMDPADDDYLGAPPSEIVPLIDETREAALTLKRLANKAKKGDCGESDKGQCSDLRVDLWLALGDMEEALAAWKPYL